MVKVNVIVGSESTERPLFSLLPGQICNMWIISVQHSGIKFNKENIFNY